MPAEALARRAGPTRRPGSEAMEYLFLALSALASGVVNAVWLLRRRRPVRRIVVFKIDHLGDLVTAAPALEALRADFPGAEITLVVGSWCEELAREGVEHDVLVVYDSPTYARGRAAGGALARLRGSLAGAPYDLAVGLRDDAATVLFCLLGGARRRRDRGTVRTVRAWQRALARLAGRRVPPVHEIETNLRAVGRAPAGRLPVPALRVRDELRKALRDGPLSGWTGERPLVVVHPGGAWEHRRWPAERHAAVARRLAEDEGAEVVVTGAADERPLAESVAAGAAHCRVLAGELGIGQMMALLSEASLYLGSDTGIMHVAVGVGTPVVALFGPGDADRFGPVGPRDVVLSADLDCAPCPQRRCPYDGRCMKALSVEQVYDVAAGVLRERPAVAGGGSAA